jgi:pantoate--beta-alanine ligase
MTAATDLIQIVRDKIGESSLARIDYIELVDADTLEPVTTMASNSVLVLAVFFGNTRLIDNIRLP